MDAIRDVVLETGALGRAIAPAGASRGMREAIDLRDGGGALPGKGVAKALANVDGPTADALVGLDAADQAAADAALLALDPSPMKETLGGNATVATSLAVLHAAAAGAGRPLWRHVAESYGTTPSIPLSEIQIFGTVSQAVAIFTAARERGGVVVSARSGETEDVSISHLAVGLGSGQLEVGSFQRSDRMVKWNECLRIQDTLGADTFVAGAPLC